MLGRAVLIVLGVQVFLPPFSGVHSRCGSLLLLFFAVAGGWVDAPADFRHMCGLLLALCGWLLVLVGCERPYVSVLLVGKLLALADCRFFQWSWRLGVLDVPPLSRVF